MAAGGLGQLAGEEGQSLGHVLNVQDTGRGKGFLGDILVVAGS